MNNKAMRAMCRARGAGMREIRKRRRAFQKSKSSSTSDDDAHAFQKSQQ